MPLFIAIKLKDVKSQLKIDMRACQCYNGVVMWSIRRELLGNWEKEAGWVKCPPLWAINQARGTQIQSGGLKKHPSPVSPSFYFLRWLTVEMISTWTWWEAKSFDPPQLWDASIQCGERLLIKMSFTLYTWWEAKSYTMWREVANQGIIRA